VNAVAFRDERGDQIANVAEVAAKLYFGFAPVGLDLPNDDVGFGLLRVPFIAFGFFEGHGDDVFVSFADPFRFAPTDN
jgi:hypothetical protein